MDGEFGSCRSQYFGQRNSRDLSLKRCPIAIVISFEFAFGMRAGDGFVVISCAERLNG